MYFGHTIPSAAQKPPNASHLQASNLGAGSLEAEQGALPGMSRRQLLQRLGAVCGLGFLGISLPRTAAEEQGNNNGSTAPISPWPYRQQVDRFILYSNQTLDVAPQVLQEWAELKNDVQELLQIDCEQGEVHFVVFDQEQTFREYIQHYFPKIPLRRALFIKHRGPGIIFTYRHDDLLLDLRHEGTHALLTEACGTLPMWLDEGLAEYFETTPEHRFAGSPHLKETRWRARLGQMPDLRRLEAIVSMSDMSGTDYRDAWAWVHFLLHRSQDSRDLLTNYLAHSSTLGTDFRFYTQISTLFTDGRQEFLSHFRSYPVTIDP